MKRILLLFFTLLCLSGYGQNKLTELYQIRPDINYPGNMPHVQQWIEAVLPPLFVSSLQTSDSPNSDNQYLSFWLVGKSSLNFILPNTNGLRMQFHPIPNAPNTRSQTLGVEFQHAILAYDKDFNFTDWEFSPENYFSSAIQILGFSDQQLIAHTLQNIVQPDKAGKSKTHQLIDDLNRHLKTIMPYPAGENPEDLVQVLTLHLPSKISTALYQTYIQQGNNQQQAFQNLESFFAGFGVFQENVVATIDRLIAPTVKTSLAKAENITFPASLLSPVSGVRSGQDTIRFYYQHLEAQLDYKNRKLELTFTGRLNQKAQLHTGRLFRHNHNSHKMEWAVPAKKLTQAVDFKELKVIVAEEGITVEALTPDENRLELVRNVWPD